MKRLVLILLLGIFLVGVVSAEQITGLVCRGSTYDWDFTHSPCPYPNVPCYNINCDARGDKCCSAGATTATVDCPYGGYLCTGACTPTNRIVCNSAPPCSGNDYYSNGTWSQCNSSGSQVLISTCVEGGTCTLGCTVGTTINYTQSCVYLDKPYFASLNQPNINISSADLGDTVLLRFPGVNLVAGQNITFYVNTFNSSNAVWWNPFTWFGGKKQWSSFTKISGNATEIFNITSSDKHRINASANESAGWKQSNNLTIITGNPNANSVPVATILSPLNGKKYKINSSIEFNQTSDDADDLLRITWNFGDGTSNFSTSNYLKILDENSANTKHNYTQSGSYNVVLTAKEMERTQSDTDSVHVSIFNEGLNIKPIIASPLEGQTVGTGVVFFNISNSYIFNCSSCAGSCVGTRSGGFYTDDGLLNCTYILSPGDLAPSFGRVFVNWSLGDGVYKVGNWTQNYNSTVNFGYYYSTAGVHIATVRLDYYA